MENNTIPQSNAPQNNAPQNNISKSTPKKENRTYTTRETLGAVFIFLISFLFCRSFPFVSFPLGNYTVCILALLLCAVHLILKKPEKSSPSAYPFLLFCILFAFSALFTSNGFLLFFSYCAFILSLILFLFFIRRNGTGNAESRYLFYNSLHAIFRTPASSGANCINAMIYPLKNGKFKSVGVKIKYVLLGLAATIVPTVIVLINLSYDSRFTNLLEDIFTFDGASDITRYFISALVAIPVSAYFFSLAVGCCDNETNEDERTKRTAGYDGTKKRLRAIPTLSVLTAAVPLVFLYVVFFISQIEEYTSAFTGVLPEGFIYSDYARSGFFELCRVAALNALVILVSSICSRRSGERAPLASRLVCVILSLCSLVLIATALAKMFLYINAYGMTQKRVYVSLFMLLMSVGFILCIAAQFIPKIKMSWICVCLSVVFITLPSYADLDGMIYSYNVDRYISDTLGSFDYDAAYYDPYAALPSLARLYESDAATPEDKARIRQIAKFTAIEFDNEGSIYRFSIQRYKAETAISTILTEEK